VRVFQKAEFLEARIFPQALLSLYFTLVIEDKAFRVIFRSRRPVRVVIRFDPDESRSIVPGKFQVCASIANSLREFS
jgi:hypothetical protein